MIFDSVKDIPGLDKIKLRLKKRGLEMIEDRVWEKHGAHAGMNYMVIIGTCRWTKFHTETVVAIYPTKIYDVGEYDKWNQNYPENVIPVARDST